MKTTFALISDRCGLSHRGSAAFLNVRIDTVKSWSSGRNPAPPWAIDALRKLYARIENAARQAGEQIADVIKKHGVLQEIELGIASDDYEAQRQPLGWPCVGAQAAMLGIVAARSSLSIKIVPRGTTLATAAAADALDQGK
jgi:hypothetical protein